MTEEPRRSFFHESAGRAPGRGRLAGRRILVVGGGQRDIEDPDPPIGNGRAATILYAREGAHVACADVSGPAADGTVAAVTEEGGRAFAIEADVADPSAVESMVAHAAERLGGLDGLLLNVGVSGPPLGLAGESPDEWDRVMAINLRSHMLTCRAALPGTRNPCRSTARGRVGRPLMHPCS